jgi:hypothetical protein
MWLPIEIVNYIFDYTNTGLYLIYCNKQRKHLLRINTNHDKFRTIHSMYKNMEVYNPVIQEENEHNTQISYNIPLRKIPSVVNRLENIASVSNYMSIVIVEKDDEVVKEHHTSTVIHTKESALLLN